jgi:hypothetical protein
VGLSFYFHVARRVFDPNKDNFFISGAPGNTGVHSSPMEMLFTRTYHIDPELSARPDWYSQAFSCTGAPITSARFFEPADVIRDLAQITGAMLARNAQVNTTGAHNWRTAKMILKKKVGAHRVQFTKRLPTVLSVKQNHGIC